MWATWGREEGTAHIAHHGGGGFYSLTTPQRGRHEKPGPVSLNRSGHYLPESHSGVSQPVGSQATWADGNLCSVCSVVEFR